jgi:hypothetical protein
LSEQSYGALNTFFAGCDDTGQLITATSMLFRGGAGNLRRAPKALSPHNVAIQLGKNIDICPFTTDALNTQGRGKCARLPVMTCV